jgi:hypothetical protein
MYTNLPHEAIIASLIWLLALFKSQSGRFGLWISKDVVGFQKMEPGALFSLVTLYSSLLLSISTMPYSSWDQFVFYRC